MICLRSTFVNSVLMFDVAIPFDLRGNDLVCYFLWLLKSLWCFYKPSLQHVFVKLVCFLRESFSTLHLILNAYFVQTV